MLPAPESLMADTNTKVTPVPPPPPKPGVKTSEFWTAIATVAVNLILVFSLLGWVKSEHVVPLSSAVDQIIAGLSTVINLLVWKWYNNKRAEIKAAHQEAYVKTVQPDQDPTKN